jgi:OmpA-OmpF porin, OOP family
MLRTIGLVLSAALLPIWPAAARTPPLPGWVGLPPEILSSSPDQLTFEMYGEAEFQPEPSDEVVLRRGKHWNAGLRIDGMAESVDGKAIWARIKPALTRAGWVVVAEHYLNPFSATLRFQNKDIDAWANIVLFGADDIRLDVVENATQQMALTLETPAAQPERVSPERGDFPYLAALPGSKFQYGRRNDTPMSVTPPGQFEPEIVGSAPIVKYYTSPEGLSNLQFVTVYAGALMNAGWTVVLQSQGIHQADGTLIAHYSQKERDIWAALHGTPSEYSITIADADARDLSSELAGNCHVALYGVLFDFNKATLKSDSDPVLGRVRETLRREPALRLEVQGHTDAVGDNADSQSLSAARARSVVTWLTRHGVTPERLTAKGYGGTMPISDNDTDLGRAKNRRVEVATPGCAAR